MSPQAIFKRISYGDPPPMAYPDRALGIAAAKAVSVWDISAKYASIPKDFAEFCITLHKVSPIEYNN
jgi:hypothetical protein